MLPLTFLSITCIIMSPASLEYCVQLCRSDLYTLCSFTLSLGIINVGVPREIWSKWAKTLKRSVVHMSASLLQEILGGHLRWCACAVCVSDAAVCGVSETLLISSGSSGKLKLSRDSPSLCLWFISVPWEKSITIIYPLEEKRYCSRSWMTRKQNISLLFYPEGLESFWGRLDHGLIHRHHSGTETLIRTNHSRDPLFLRISCSLYSASWRSWEN